MFNRHYAKFQYFNKIFVNNYIFYDFNFFKNRNDNYFYNFNFFFSIFSKKSFYYFYNHHFKHVKNSSLNFAWFTEEPTNTKLIVPYYFLSDDYLYPIDQYKNLNFAFDQILDFFFVLFLKKNIELRKIITLLFYFKIFKS